MNEGLAYFSQYASGGLSTKGFIKGFDYSFGKKVGGTREGIKTMIFER